MLDRRRLRMSPPRPPLSEVFHEVNESVFDCFAEPEQLTTLCFDISSELPRKSQPCSAVGISVFEIAHHRKRVKFQSNPVPRLLERRWNGLDASVENSRDSSLLTE